MSIRVGLLICLVFLWSATLGYVKSFEYFWFVLSGYGNLLRDAIIRDDSYTTGFVAGLQPYNPLKVDQKLLMALFECG